MCFMVRSCAANSQLIIADTTILFLAHRTIYTQRRVLHRDMSAYNILIYPQWPKIKDRKVIESAPPFIRDILDGIR